MEKKSETIYVTSLIYYYFKVYDILRYYRLLYFFLHCAKLIKSAIVTNTKQSNLTNLTSLTSSVTLMQGTHHWHLISLIAQNILLHCALKVF